MLEHLERQTSLTNNQRKIVFAAILGDMLDFFDFYLIGFVLAFIVGSWKLTYGQSAMILLSSGLGAVRTGRPPHLDAGRPSPPKPPMTAEELAARALEPLPESGNLLGFLAVAQKTDIELSAGTPVERAAIVGRVQTIQTRGDADAYIKEVMAKVSALRVAHAAAVRAALTKKGYKKS